jgi:hypothetical protein
MPSERGKGLRFVIICFLDGLSLHKGLATFLDGSLRPV